MNNIIRLNINRGNIINAIHSVDAIVVSCNQQLLGPKNKSHWRFNKKNVEQAGMYIYRENKNIFSPCQ